MPTPFCNTRILTHATLWSRTGVQAFLFYALTGHRYESLEVKLI